MLGVEVWNIRFSFGCEGYLIVGSYMCFLLVG